MFVEYSAETRMPVQLVSELLATNSREMEGRGAVAYRRGEELRSRVGPGGLLAKEVVIAIDPPLMSRRALVIPVRWRATGAEALFPRLDGELVVGETDSGNTEIRLQATYRPPLGSIGGLMDRVLLARLARATVSEWVDRIVEWLEETRSAERDDDLHYSARPNH